MAFDFELANDRYDGVTGLLVSKDDHMRLVNEINQRFSDVRRQLRQNKGLEDIHIAKYKYDKNFKPYIEVYTSAWTTYDHPQYAIEFQQMYLGNPLLFKTIRWKLMPPLWKITVGYKNLLLREPATKISIGDKYAAYGYNVDIDKLKDYMDFLLNKDFSQQSVCKHIWACALFCNIINQSTIEPLRDIFLNFEEIEKFTRWYVGMCKSRKWRTCNPMKIEDTRYTWSVVYKNTVQYFAYCDQMKAIIT